MSMFTLAITCLITSNLPWFMDLTFQVPMQYCSVQHRTFTTRHIQNWVSFLLWTSLFILSEAISQLLPSSMLDNYQAGGAHLLASNLFAFSYYSWGYWAKDELCCAKSLQSCLTLCDTMEEPTMLFIPWDSPGKILGWVAISFSRGSSQPTDPLKSPTCVLLSLLNWQGGFFTTSAAWEA